VYTYVQQAPVSPASELRAVAQQVFAARIRLAGSHLSSEEAQAALSYLDEAEALLWHATDREAHRLAELARQPSEAADQRRRAA
jgi:hypothetical protein